MINPKELRIGNLVKVVNHNLIISGITDSFVTFQRKLNCSVESADIESLDPILLTHEILEKVGFSYYHTHPTLSEWFIHDNPNMLGAIVFEDGKYVYEGYEYEIQSVHQLQNLFYAITGEELEIKL